VAGNGTTGSNLDLDPSDVGIKPLNLTNFNPGNIVTPGVTGLKRSQRPPATCITMAFASR